MSIKAPLMGRLGAAPEVKALPDGTIIVNLAIVTKGRRKNRQTDEWEDHNVTWWRAHAFGDLAERLAANLVKGDPVILFGEGYNRSYETSDGEKRTNLEFKIENGGLDWRWSDKQVRPPTPPATPAQAQQQAAYHSAQQAYGAPPQQPQSAPSSAGPYDWPDKPPF